MKKMEKDQSLVKLKLTRKQEKKFHFFNLGLKIIGKNY